MNYDSECELCRVAAPYASLPTLITGASTFGELHPIEFRTLTLANFKERLRAHHQYYPICKTNDKCLLVFYIIARRFRHHARNTGDLGKLSVTEASCTPTV